MVAEVYDSVTILFADIVGFTSMCSVIEPADMLDMLNDLFARWDALASKHGVEKIKTIGDAYMVAGGCPIRSPNHAEHIMELAIDMLAALEQFNQNSVDK